jgi:twitching motility protein PilT
MVRPPEEDAKMQTLSVTKENESQVLKALGECSLFRALKPEQIAQLLKAAELVAYEPNETIVRQGEPSDSFLVIIDGMAVVTADRGDGEVQLGQIPLPSSLGEVSLLLREPRTATVTARGNVQALKFSAKAFEAMFKKIPEFGTALAEGLAFRLQRLSDRIEIPVAVRPQPPGAEVLDMLPMELIQRHRVLPLRIDDNVLTLGLVDPPTTQVITAVQGLLPSFEVRPLRIELEFFNDVLNRHGGLKGWGDAKKEAEAVAGPVAPLRLQKLLERVVAEGASDLHLSAGHKPHWRVDGDMKPMSDMPALGAEEVLELLRPVMEERHRKQFSEENDSDFAYALPGSARFRVNIFRDRHGVSAVMRQIPSKILTFEQLALPPIVKGFCDIPKGLVLVTGPTGSGKSTTLAAMVDYINRTKKAHIVTLEDPIEFVHASQGCLINQREVGGHTRSFARALKAALREDPDIVLVGEMRDLETIALALETANTGHLVFATLHTNNAVSAVDRIIDQFPAGQQEQIRSVLSDVLRGVVAQTLLRKKGGGRLAALEILAISPAVANLIREGKTVQLTGVMQINKGMGMQLLNDELAQLIETGKVDMDEAVAAAVDKDDLSRRFRTGITLGQASLADETFRVMSVAPSSPGAQAGMSRGDHVIELDGKPSKEFTLDEMRKAIRLDGKRQVTVNRDGKRFRLVMELGGGRESLMVPVVGAGARPAPRREV